MLWGAQTKYMEGGPQTSKHFASSTVTTFKKQVFVKSTRAADKPTEQGGIVSKASAGAWFLDCLGAQCSNPGSRKESPWACSEAGFPSL